MSARVRVRFALAVIAVASPACAERRLPVVVLPPPPAAKPLVVTDDRPAPPARDDRVFAGCWIEDVAGRGACADTITIEEANGRLSVTSEDCTDGEAYVVERAEADGAMLELTLRVPGNGTRIEYRLHAAEHAVVEGTMRVTIGSDVSTLDVAWARCGDPEPKRRAKRR